MVFNPFATRKVARAETPSTPIADDPDYSAPNSRYAVPSLESGSPYNDEFGWAPKSLRPSTVDYPSAQRMGVFPRQDFRPNPDEPPENFYERYRSDIGVRHQVETVDADGWTERKGVFPGDRRWADNPNRTPPPEPRLTSVMAPRSYFFERPFDVSSARRFNGNHFSMADHRRDWEMQEYGMAPVRQPRNTYRIEPPPWDADIVDMPKQFSPPNGKTTGFDIPPGRTWRLM